MHDVYAATFQALGEPIRLRILTLIAERDEMPCSVLDRTLPISKSTLSYHMKVLHQADLISARKQGRSFFYTNRREVLEERLPGFAAKLLADRPSDRSLRSRGEPARVNPLG